MVQVSRRNFTVTTEGVGRPDYSPAVAVSKLITDTHQQAFTHALAADIAAGSALGVSIYTVPTGYRLALGSLVISCSGSSIQRFHLHSTLAGVLVYILDEFQYDMRGSIVWGPESVVELTVGTILGMTLFNYDTVERLFGVTISGFLERIA